MENIVIFTVYFKNEREIKMSSEKNIMYMDHLKAKELCEKIFVAQGVAPADASIVADNLIGADLRGISSHGISRMMVYSNRLSLGMTNLKAKMNILNETPSALHIDADNGFGAPAGIKAMEKCIEKAKKSGSAICTVTHSNHFGYAAFYSMRALEHDMIGLSLSNAPGTMAPWGGINPMLGTNPFCFAVPTAKHYPLVLDCATSLVARGKINLADIEGQPIPEGWAQDDKGRPTTDAVEALKGTVLPFGNYKGSGLSMMIDVLCALLGGGSYGANIGGLYGDSTDKQNLGHFFAAIDIKVFQDPQTFKLRVDSMIDEIKGSEKSIGVEEIYVPGELEYLNTRFYSEKGIEVGPGVIGDLEILCEKNGVKADLREYLK